MSKLKWFLKAGAFVVVVGCLGGSMAQADTIVAPIANTATSGSTEQFALFGESGSSNTFQWLLNASQLTAMVGDTVSGIGFRLASGQANVAPSVIGTFDLQLSSSNNPIGSLSATSSANVGANAVTVYDSSLSLPALTGGVGPNPFFVINFSTPFSYTGGDLLMTLLTSSNDSFAVDANPVGDGLGDTSSNVGGVAKAEFFNYPVTEFVYSSTSVPEPGDGWFVVLAVFLAATFVRQRRQQKGFSRS